MFITSGTTSRRESRPSVAKRMVAVAIAFAIVASTATSVFACPFCAAVSQTFSEEITAMDVVVVAKLVHAPKIPDSELSDPNATLPKAKFKVTEVIKGEKWVNSESTIEVLYFGESEDKDELFLMMGADAPHLMWSTPLGINQRVYEYIQKAIEQPETAERLQYFQEFLEDEDEMLARDAYDEFAKTPYDGVIALKEHMHRDRLLNWIQDTKIPASRRRLYYTMLGVCGTPQDATLLEEMMQSGDRKVKAGLDAMIACYLLLKPGTGLEKVDELFLKNDKAEYADTYAAIMAIRFHGSEADAIPRERLTKSLRYMLDRPELADLVIPDLARWQDWDVMPRLVELFKTADDKSSWVRVPVVNYLRACPDPKAIDYLAELERIDPDAVKRAMTFFPFKPEDDEKSDKEEEKGQAAANSEDNNAESKTTAVPEGDPSAGEANANDVTFIEATIEDDQLPYLTSETDSKSMAVADEEIEQPPVPTESHETVDSTPQLATKPIDNKNSSGPAGNTEDAAIAAKASQEDSDSQGKGEGEAVAAANSPRLSGNAAELGTAPNLMILLGVPLLFGIILLLTMRLILGLPQPDAT